MLWSLPIWKLLDLKEYIPENKVRQFLKFNRQYNHYNKPKTCWKTTRFHRLTRLSWGWISFLLHWKKRLSIMKNACILPWISGIANVFAAHRWNSSRTNMSACADEMDIFYGRQRYKCLLVHVQQYWITS